MKNKFFVFGCFFLFLFRLNYVHAEVCDSEDITRMKVLAKNVTVNYNYVGDIFYDGNYQLYEISFDFGELDGSVFIGASLDSERVYHSSEKLYVDSGNQIFHIYSSNCSEYEVGSVRVTLPKFNVFSLEEECSYSASSLEVCDEWYQGSLNSTRFRELVDSYYQSVEEENENEILNYVLEHSWYFIIGGLVLLILIIFLVIRRIRKNRLD